MRLVLPFASALSLLLASGIVQSAEQKRAFAGEPVGEVLDNLRAQGLTFIYNTRIVAPALRVDSEPRARSGLPLAREILAAHGLDVSEVTSGVYAVTMRKRNAPPIAETPVAPAADTMLEEVVVHTSRYTLLAGSAAPDVLLTHEDIRDMPRLGEETLRAVQSLPGVATNGFSSVGSVRGGEPNETAIVLDGLRLYEPFHLKNFLSPVSLLDSRLIDSMHVYSGGFPVTYGDRMSSIIDAASLDPVQARYYEAGLSLFTPTHSHPRSSLTGADRD
jgi:TonB-dependent Receptor Plug Domain